MPVTNCEGIAMIFIGLINNIFFLIVMSSGQRIVSHFDAAGKLGLINWASSFCGLFATSLNGGFSSLNLSYDIRFVVTALCSVVGLLGCALAPTFWVALVSILFIGFACNFGESVAFGFMAFVRKQELVKFWGVGTGIAGIMGSGYSAFCCAYPDFKYTYSFYVLLPLIIVYCAAYWFVLRARPDPKLIPLLSQSDGAANGEKEGEETPKVQCISCSLLRRIAYYMLTCDAAYFIEYSVAGAFLDCAQTGDRVNMKYLFPLLGLAQHIGVLLFCGSLQFFAFPWLWVIVVAQCGSFAVWLTQAMLHWMPLWSEFVFIFIVGGLSGLSYVNTYHCVLVDERLSEKEKELGSNFTGCTVTVAVLLSSVFTYVSEQTYLKPFVPKS
jgi:hypothetical protein